MRLLVCVVLAAHSPLEKRPCAQCHPPQAETQAQSRHALAYADPLFQRSWEHSGHRAWCLTCHDPLGAGEGVSCRACHLDPDEPTTSEACATCHQFKAPEDRFQAVWLQDTLGEWRRAGAKKPCAECHFPNGNHRSPGGHDLPLLQETLGVSWEGHCATVEARGAGHPVPTGDPFHMLRLSVCIEEDCVVRTPGKRMMRRLLAVPDGGTEEGTDTRPRPRQRLCFPGAGRAAYWVLEQRHAEPKLEREAPAEENWVVIHRGVRPLPRE